MDFNKIYLKHAASYLSVFRKLDVKYFNGDIFIKNKSFRPESEHLFSFFAYTDFSIKIKPEFKDEKLIYHYILMKGQDAYADAKSPIHPLPIKLRQEFFVTVVNHLLSTYPGLQTFTPPYE